MPTNLSYLVYKPHLLQWCAASDAEPESGTDVATVPDLSGEGRDMACASAYPQWTDDVLNDQPVFRFNGSTHNPLIWDGSADDPLTIRHIFIVAKFDLATFAGNEGLISGVESADYALLAGAGATTSRFFDQSLGALQVYRKANAVFDNASMSAPVQAFKVMELYFPDGLVFANGWQVGRDRTGLTGARLWDGDVAEWMVYSQALPEMHRARMYSYFAQKYHLWEEDTAGKKIFPFSFDWEPDFDDKKKVLMDTAEDNTPNYRTKLGRRISLEANFTRRLETEVRAAEQFVDEHHPGARFLFRDRTVYPPRSLDFLFASETSVKSTPRRHTGFSYALSMFDGALSSYVVPEISIPAAEEPADTEAPTVPAGFSATTSSSSQINLAWSAATDNVGVTAYEVRRATDSGFTANVTDISVGNVTSYNNTGLSASTTYYYKVRARDAAGNWSAYSTADSDTTSAGAYDPVSALGSKLIVYLDADQIAGADGDPVTTIPNTGTENDWSKIDGTVTLSIESGTKAIHIASGGRIESGTTSGAQTGTCTMYAVVKMVSDPTTNCYWLRTFKFSGSNAILVGYTDNKFTWFSEGDVMGDASTTLYKLIKVTGKNTSAGEWRIGSDLDTESKFRVFIGTNAALTGPEESELEAWLNTRT